jgi:hypothetical protein
MACPLDVPLSKQHAYTVKNMVERIMKILPQGIRCHPVFSEVPSITATAREVLDYSMENVGA